MRISERIIFLPTPDLAHRTPSGLSPRLSPRRLSLRAISHDVAGLSAPMTFRTDGSGALSCSVAGLETAAALRRSGADGRCQVESWRRVLGLAALLEIGGYAALLLSLLQMLVELSVDPIAVLCD